MRLSSNTNKTLWYVLDEEDKIIFVSMFKEKAMEYLIFHADKSGSTKYN